MAENTHQLILEEINRKLDLVLEEIALQQRHRREMDDLKDDLMRVGKDVYQTAVVELEDLHDHFTTEDLLHLSKKLLRNVRTITATFEQLESIRDFLNDAAPIARDSFTSLMNTLDEFDRKGYFAFMKEMGKVIDRIVTSFSAEDVKNLGDNIVTIVNTVKTLTQPDMLRTINNAIAVYRKMEVAVPEDVSLLSLLREINTPEMRKGLAFAVRFLKSVSASTEVQSSSFEGSDNGKQRDSGKNVGI